MLALRACEIIGCADSDKSRKDFSLRLFINPGGDLLSRDLSSDYHRRSNVSLPGSEWDRVGPLGYDHQVSDAFDLCFCLSGCHLPWVGCCVFSAASALLCAQQADIRVAMCVGFPSLAFPF